MIIKLRKHNNTSAISSKFEKESLVLPKIPFLMWEVSKWFSKRFLIIFSLQLGDRGQSTKRYSQFSICDDINLRLIISLHPFSLFKQCIISNGQPASSCLFIAPPGNSTWKNVYFLLWAFYVNILKWKWFFESMEIPNLNTYLTAIISKSTRYWNTFF